MNMFTNKAVVNNAAGSMKLKLAGVLLLTFLLSGFFGKAQIVAWQFGNPASTGSEATYAATTLAANLNSSTLSRGAGISATALARAFSANNFPVSGTKANAISNNRHFQFTISAAATYKVSLSTLDVRLRRSSNDAPNAYIWRYSIDGTNFTDIGSDISFTSIADGVTQTQIDLSGISALQNVASGTTITLRLYAWGAATTGATFAIGRYAAGVTTNSLAIGGSVQSLANPPTVTTTTATSITATGASSGGDVTSDGGASVTARGVAYGTSANPTIAGTKTTDGTGTGAFSSTLSGLTPNTQYFYRAYATNSVTTSYGSEDNFRTLAATPTAPTVAVPTSTTLDVTIGGGDNNPSSTQYAIRETASGDFVQADGTLGATEAWQTASAWTTVTVSGLASSTLYNFDVKARNSNNVETGFGATGSGTTSAAGAQNQTITFGALANKAYGDASFQLTATASSGLTVTYESSNTNVATISGDVVTIVGVGTTTITASQAGNISWNPAPDVDQDLTVGTKELTVSNAVAQDKTYDGNTTAVINGATLVGIVGMDVVTVSGGGTFATADAGTGIAVTANLSLGGADAAKYTLAQPSGLSADINQASQTITFNALPNKSTADAPFNLTATASSGLTVTYNSSNTSVATISGNTVTIVGAGTTTITASQAGNGNYLAATNVDQSQVVTLAPSAVTYSFGTIAPGTADPTAGTPVANLSFSALSRGNNKGTTTLLTTTSASSGYTGASSSYNAGAAAETGSLDLDVSAYFEFTLTPASNYKVTLSSLSFGSRSTGTGPLAYSVRSSLDNYSSNVATGSLTNASTWILRSSSVGTESAYGTPITFRIYGHSGTGLASSNTANWRIDDLITNVLVEVKPPCTGTPTAGSITGATSFCVSGSTTLNLVGNSNLNSVTGLSTQWYSSTDNINFSPIGTGNETAWPTGTITQTTYYYVEVACSNSGLSDNTDTVSIIINQPTATPGAITGPLDVCPHVGTNVPITYSIDAVAGAVDYIWTVPNGATIQSGQGTTSISVLIDNSFAQTNQQFRVRTVNAAGCISDVSSLVVLKIIPGIPVAIFGPTNACTFMGQPVTVTYSIDPVPNATSYTWAVQGTGITLVSGQGGLSVEVSFASNFTTGTVRVAANANCGSRSARSLNVSRQIPTAPVEIIGQTNVCSFIGTNTLVTYSVDPVANATSYEWTVPANVTLVSGQGTNSIDVRFISGFTTSVLKVKSISNCFTSGDRQLTLTAASTSIPGAINGPTNACAFIGTPDVVSYSIKRVTNAVTYNWTVPAGITIVGHPAGNGVNDTIINVTFDNSFVNGTAIQVQAVNCNISSPRSITIYRNTSSTPSPISGPVNVCAFIISESQPSGAVATYTTRKVANATSYTWTAPVNANIVAHPGGSGVNDTIVEVIFNNNFTTGVISVSSSNGCGTSGNRNLSLTRLSPAAPGGIDVIQNGDCPQREFVYSIATLPSNATNINWTVPDNGTIISGQGTISITVQYTNAAVNGTVMATATSNCGSSSTRTIKIKLPACPVQNVAGDGQAASRLPVGINPDTKEDMMVSVYPNPAINHFRLQVNTSGKEQITARLLDLQGRELKRMIMMPDALTTFGSDLKPGTYMLEVLQGTRRSVQKLIKY